MSFNNVAVITVKKTEKSTLKKRKRYDGKNKDKLKK